MLPLLQEMSGVIIHSFIMQCYAKKPCIILHVTWHAPHKTRNYTSAPMCSYTRGYPQRSNVSCGGKSGTLMAGGMSF